MERTQRTPAAERSGRPAAQRFAASNAATVVDDRPEAVAPREPADTGHDSPGTKAQQASIRGVLSSPRVVAQARRLDGLFGAAQLRPDPANASFYRPSPAARRQDVVVQRAEVLTSGGQFSSTPEDGQVKPLKKPKIAIVFTPGEKVRSEKIGFIQTVRVHGSPSERSVPYSPTSSKNETQKGWSVDRTANKSNPVYGAADLEPGQSLADSTTKVSYVTFGRQNERETIPAKMEDEPLLPDLEAGGGMQFETTALDLNAQETGSYYGSVHWAYAVKDDGKMEVQDLTLGQPGNPSADFFEAAERWNGSSPMGALETKRSTTIGETAVAARLPLFELDEGNTEYMRERGITYMKLYSDKPRAMGWVPTEDVLDKGKDTRNTPVPRGVPASAGAPH